MFVWTGVCIPVPACVATRDQAQVDESCYCKLFQWKTQNGWGRCKKGVCTVTATFSDVGEVVEGRQF